MKSDGWHEMINSDIVIVNLYNIYSEIQWYICKSLKTIKSVSTFVVSSNLKDSFNNQCLSFCFFVFGVLFIFVVLSFGVLFIFVVLFFLVSCLYLLCFYGVFFIIVVLFWCLVYICCAFFFGVMFIFVVLFFGVLFIFVVLFSHFWMVFDFFIEYTEQN